ncbi:MAG: leucine-rich repeat domain-containing protein [Prevotella sp.]|nr:leucine-rich repeat domain-containing protein [Prevotella sp.]
MRNKYLRAMLSLVGLLAFSSVFADNGIPDFYYTYDLEREGIYYTLDTTNQTLTVSAGDNMYSGDIIIPDEVTFSTRTLPVVAIRAFAFAHCTGLKSIVIGNNVKTIGTSSFSYCTGLKSVVIGNNVNIIQGSAFNSCSSLEEITMPGSLTKLGDEAFQDCSSLKKVTFLDGEGDVVLENFLQDYAGMQFGGCPIEEVFLGKNLTWKKQNSFSTQYAQPWYAFASCTTIKSITIGKFVTEIKCFAGCSNITSIVSNITDPSQCPTITLPTKVYASAMLTVPNGTSAQYVATGDWSKFLNIEEDAPAVPVYTLSITGGMGGSVAYGDAVVQNSMQEFEVQEGDEVTLTITPDEGYLLESATVNGDDRTGEVTGGMLALGQITQATDVEVTFAEDNSPIDDGKHSLTVVCDPNGTVFFGESSVSGETEVFRVEDNASATLRVVPALGYRIALVLLNDVEITDMLVNGSYTIRRVRSDMTFEVEFEEDPATLTISMADRGAVTMDALSGSTYDFTITAAPYWGIHSVTFDGEDITALVDSEGRLTTPEVRGNAVLNIAFERTGQPTQAKGLDANTMRVWAQGTTLHIDNAPQGEQVEVCTADGLRVRTFAGGTVQAELPKGEVYIIRCGAKTVKIAL